MFEVESANIIELKKRIEDERGSFDEDIFDALRD